MNTTNNKLSEKEKMAIKKCFDLAGENEQLRAICITLMDIIDGKDSHHNFPKKMKESSQDLLERAKMYLDGKNSMFQSKTCLRGVK